MKNNTHLVLALCFAVASALHAAESASNAKSTIPFFDADDMGYGDLGAAVGLI